MERGIEEDGLYGEPLEGRTAVVSKNQKKIEAPIDSKFVLIP